MDYQQAVLYFISGLGADERVFRDLNLPGYTIKHIPWLAPQEHETIAHYAGRMGEKIVDDHFLLIGLSFGGMISMEIAKLRPVPGIILLSSIATKDSMPPVYPKLANSFLPKWIPDKWLTKYNGMLVHMLGTTVEANKRLVKEMLIQNDPAYLRWAIDVIANWQNTEIAAPTIQIHGSKDKVFPIAKTQADIVIDGGAHLMVLDKADESSKAILQAIARLREIGNNKECS